MKMVDWLIGVARVSSQSGRPDEDFFYLGGPMTGIAQFNFPEFNRAAALLRNAGYNIVSPAELDDPQEHALAMASADGKAHEAVGKPWESFLSRDCVIVSMPTCVGGIFLPGWESSRGAQLESFILDRLRKPLYLYDNGLIQIDRDQCLSYSMGSV